MNAGGITVMDSVQSPAGVSGHSNDGRHHQQTPGPDTGGGVQSGPCAGYRGLWDSVQWTEGG